MAKVEATIVQPTSTSEKFKKLLEVEKVLNKQFGVDKSLVRLGDRVGLKLPSIPTNLPSIDNYIIGTGGIPRGRIIEIFGPESSGKTTVSLHIAAQEQKLGGLVAFVDAEHSLDPTYASNLGVDVDNLIVSQPDSGEQALETVEALVDSEAISLIIIDSVAAIVPKAELDGEMGDSHMGLQARLMSQACRKLTGKCARLGVTLIFINQIREKIGVMFGSPETTTGGRALKFYSSVRLDVRRREAIKNGEIVIGHHIDIKAVKNKCNAPLKKCTIDLLYDPVHLDVEGNIIEFASDNNILERTGAWYKYKGENIGNGLENTKVSIKNNPKLLASIREDIERL